MWDLFHQLLLLMEYYLTTYDPIENKSSRREIKK